MSKGQKVTGEKNEVLPRSIAKWCHCLNYGCTETKIEKSTQKIYFFINYTSFQQALTMCRHHKSRIEKLTK